MTTQPQLTEGEDMNTFQERIQKLPAGIKLELTLVVKKENDRYLIMESGHDILVEEISQDQDFTILDYPFKQGDLVRVRETSAPAGAPAIVVESNAYYVKIYTFIDGEGIDMNLRHGELEMIRKGDIK